MLRIFPAHMHIRKPVATVHRVHRHHHIVRRAGQRIDRTHGDHAANLQCRVDLPRRFHRQRAGDQLIVRRLIHHRFTIFARQVFQPRVGERREIFVIIGLVVDLIEGHPVFHFVLIAGKYHFREAHEEIDQLTVTPAAIFRDQMVRHFKMRQRNHRLNTVLQAFIKQGVIKLQTRFIRL